MRKQDADMSPDGGTHTKRADGSRWSRADIKVPDIKDLAKRLRFAPQQGRIWLDDQRMMLMHISNLGSLRQELIEGMGKERARGLITRIGYQAGARDAQMSRKVRANRSTFDDFLAGPQLVSLEGIVFCEPLGLHIDVEKGEYFGDFHLVDCAEAEAHIATYGIGNEGVCWMLVGYACGYTSAFMGRPILWREVECRSMGHEKCRVIGKPVEEWEDATHDLRFLQIGDFVKWSTSDAPARDVSQAGISPQPKAGTDNAFGMVGISSGFNTVVHMVKKSRRPKRPCSSRARAALARKSSRTTCTSSARARTNPSLRSTALRFPSI